LPSTLAALAALGVQSGPGEVTSRAALVVNAGEGQVTTAIVRDGVLLLHRALELEPEMRGGPEETVPVGAGYAPIDAEEVLEAQMSEARPPSFGREVAQAVSVAAAYFEDTLSSSPELLLAAGTTGAESLQSMLHANGLVELRVREMMEPGMLDAGAATVRVPRGWLAGVKGALTN
jgi:type IV pilus assembly protein PilM